MRRHSQNRMKKCLSAAWNFEGSFAFNKTYDAPNPALELQGLGTVGVPLGPVGAGAIKSVAHQAPFGMGEQTIVDTTVRDTWEMDAATVRQVINTVYIELTLSYHYRFRLVTQPGSRSSIKRLRKFAPC